MAINFSQVKKFEITYPYEQVEYIYFNGVDNYIDLNYSFNKILEFEFSLDTSSSGPCILGYARNYAVGPYFVLFRYVTKTIEIRYNNANYQSYLNYPTRDFTVGKKYKFHINPSTKYYSLSDDNGLIFEDTTNVSLPSIKPLLMANYNNENTSNPFVEDFAEGKVYSVKLGTNQLVPCINKSNNKVGFVDSNLVFYELQGTVTSSSIGNIVANTITLPLVEVKQINKGNDIIWKRNRVVSITLSGQNTSLPINSQFSFGGIVTATYSDGTTANVTASTTFSGYNMSVASTQTILASYTEMGVTKTATYNLDVFALSSISLSGQTTTLPLDSTFSFDGTVTATYTNGTTADVTNSTTFSGYDMSTAGTQTVTASYTENGITKTTTYELIVKYYPYRRLEYIQFNGSDNYLTVNTRPELEKYYFLQFKLDSDTGTNSCLLASNGDRTTSGTMRCNHNVNSGNMRVRWGRNNASDTVITTIDYSHKYEARHRVYSNSYQHWMSFYDLTTSTDNGNYFNTNNATYTYTPSNMTIYKLMCWVDENGTPQANSYAKGKVYRYYIRNGGDSGTISTDMYPCQRKSDGKVGLYNVSNSTFYPMSGSNTTSSSAAGPVLDENWDLTTPS